MREKTPFILVYSIFTSILDFLATPRSSEELLRTLTLEDLINVATLDGTLPYTDKRVRALVWELKYHRTGRAAQLAGEYISDLLLAIAQEEIGKPLLIPVPMHAARKKERGYNQTEVLCEHALQHLGDAYEYAPDILERVRHTTPQQGLAKHKRLWNVVGSMKIKDPARVAGRVCCVVDDVSTTGATFEEARTQLRLSGARRVICLPLAQS